MTVARAIPPGRWSFIAGASSTAYSPTQTWVLRLSTYVPLSGRGAADFGGQAAVLAVLGQIGVDVDSLELGDAPGLPGFELGGVSERELLQTLRLALPVLPKVLIPLRRQGRGVQRLVLVASLLRLAAQDQHSGPIAAFEEPEEALEPLRQAQMAAMIRDVADRGGQCSWLPIRRTSHGRSPWKTCTSWPHIRAARR